MASLWYLIPISIIVGVIALVVFFWSLRSGQYEDLDGAAERILYADDVPAGGTGKATVKTKTNGASKKIP